MCSAAVNAVLGTDPDSVAYVQHKSFIRQRLVAAQNMVFEHHELLVLAWLELLDAFRFSTPSTLSQVVTSLGSRYSGSASSRSASAHCQCHPPHTKESLHLLYGPVMLPLLLGGPSTLAAQSRGAGSTCML